MMWVYLEFVIKRKAQLNCNGHFVIIFTVVFDPFVLGGALLRKLRKRLFTLPHMTTAVRFSRKDNKNAVTTEFCCFESSPCSH